MTRNSFVYQTDLESAQLWQYVCLQIPKSAAAVGDEQLTVSRVPVLAFNGAADPIEQPRNMAGAQKYWPDSREIALPGQGHDVNTDSWGACAGPLTQTFIEQASVAHLDASCLATVPAPVGLDYWIWPRRPAGLGSSLSDLFGRLPDRALSARLSDGAGPA